MDATEKQALVGRRVRVTHRRGGLSQFGVIRDVHQLADGSFDPDQIWVLMDDDETEAPILVGLDGLDLLSA